MSRALYLGDEAHAAAWRLAGIDVCVVGADTDIPAVFAVACTQADLLLLSAACAARVPSVQLEQARRALAPLLMLLPDSAALAGESELALRVRSQLGMEP